MTTSLLAMTAAMMVFAFVMVRAALTDITALTISNKLVGSFALAYLLLAPLSGVTIGEIGWSSVVAGGVLLSTFAMFAFGWMGGGDAKLASVTALWFGPDFTLVFLLNTAVLGGALTMAILTFRSMTLPPLLQNGSWIERLHSKSTGVPYGVAIGAAAVLVFPDTRWMISLF